MNLETRKEYILITVEENSFNEFFKDFEKQHIKIEENHLIIDFSSLNSITEKNISLFLSYANIHVNNGTSFVLICKDIDIDQFPEDFNIVPTLIEAEDIIEMENIQRDLGF